MKIETILAITISLLTARGALAVPSCLFSHRRGATETVAVHWGRASETLTLRFTPLPIKDPPPAVSRRNLLRHPSSPIRQWRRLHHLATKQKYSRSWKIQLHFQEHQIFSEIQAKIKLLAILNFRIAIYWDDVVGFLKMADYKRPLNQEVSYANMSKKKNITPEEFVAEAYEAGLRLTAMLKI